MTLEEVVKISEEWKKHAYELEGQCQQYLVTITKLKADLRMKQVIIDALVLTIDSH